MSKTFSTPKGWRKGEPLVCSKETMHGKPIWLVEQKPGLPIKTDPASSLMDNVACQWFHSFDEFAAFIQWWNS